MFCIYLGRKKAIIGIFVIFSASAGMMAAKNIIGEEASPFLLRCLNYLSLQGIHFGWFVAGTLAYLYYISKNKTIVIGFIFVVLLASCSKGISQIYCGIIISLLFIAPIIFVKLRFLFENKVLLFFGFVSYPLYLMHENAMIAMIVKIHNNFKFIPVILLPIIPISVLTIMAFVIVKTAEPFLRNYFNKYLYKIFFKKLTIDE
jgi:peptidoglycan/LPS O-acetylase OafA/YrhL